MGDEQHDGCVLLREDLLGRRPQCQMGGASARCRAEADQLIVVAPRFTEDLGTGIIACPHTVGHTHTLAADLFRQAAHHAGDGGEPLVILPIVRGIRPGGDEGPRHME